MGRTDHTCFDYPMTVAMLGLKNGSERISLERVRQEEGFRLCGGTDRGSVEIITLAQSPLTALKFSAKIRLGIPDIGYQDAFLPENGFSVEIPLDGMYPYVAIYQHKEWWIRPMQGTTCSTIPPKTQVLIRKREEEYEIFLAVSDRRNRADLRGTENGLLLTVSSNLWGERGLEGIAMIHGKGRDPYAMLEQAVAYALKLTGNTQKLRREKPYPDLLEKWGWCTWDSLGQSVSEREILRKMDDFKAQGIHVPWVLIDDGWSEADMGAHTLSGFGADPEKFPGGIGQTVSVLKERYGVENVGVWQAMKGYWNGLTPGSEADARCRDYMQVYPGGEISLQLKESAVFGFWNDWHKKLEADGISFIKVDSQSSFSYFAQGISAYGEMARALHNGLEASAQLHFNGNLINCMGMAPENIWNRHSSLLRSSDDYTPTVPGSFEEHALQNSFNSVYSGCLYYGDWDMVWTIHEDAKRHTLLRAISGGPLYISDGVGKTSFETLKALVLDDGTVLRCEDAGRPTLDCLTDPQVLKEKPLKVYNRYRDTLFVAVFGGEKQSGDTIRIEDMPGCDATREWWVYDHNRKMAVRYDAENGFAFDAEERSAALYQFVPADRWIGVAGMTDKLISRAGIDRIEILGDRCLIWPACEGELTVLCERPLQSAAAHAVLSENTAGEGTEKELSYVREGALIRFPNVPKNAMIELRMAQYPTA